MEYNNNNNLLFVKNVSFTSLNVKFGVVIIGVVFPPICLILFAVKLYISMSKGKKFKEK